MRKSSILGALAVALLSTSGVKAATITWQAGTDIGLAAASNLMLQVNSLVRIGLFDVPLTTVEANTNDLNYLNQHFIQLDFDRVGGSEVGGAAGYFSNNFDIDTRQTTNSFGGQQLYIFAYQSTNNTSLLSSVYSAARVALFTNSAWVLPTDPAIGQGIPGALTVDINQISVTSGGLGSGTLSPNAKLLLGNFPVTATGDGGNIQIGLVAVPEPTSAMFLGFGLVGLMAFRRRSAR